MNCTPTYPYIYQPEPADKPDGKIYRVVFSDKQSSELMTKAQADVALLLARGCANTASTTHNPDGSPREPVTYEALQKLCDEVLGVPITKRQKLQVTRSVLNWLNKQASPCVWKPQDLAGITAVVDMMGMPVEVVAYAGPKGWRIIEEKEAKP